MKFMTLRELKQPWMEDYTVVYGEDEEQDEKGDNNLSTFLDEASKKDFQEGEIYPGTIISIGNDYVMVEIGYKQEGFISTKEFVNYSGDMDIKVGDNIDVYLEKLESSLGNLILSKDKAEIIKAWDKISSACEKGTPLEGMILSKVKGGLAVDIGVKAFLPGSQIDLRPVRNLDKYLGKKMDFEVIKFNKKRGNIVLSRKSILQEERGKLRNEVLEQIQEGMIVKGVVKNLTDYGAFIDLGGIDGLLHVTDMSWGRVKHPSNIVKVGDEIEIKVLKFDPSKERISLGLKQIGPNPWDNIEQKYNIGDVVSGEIISIKEYGVFIDLGGGIEGLIHVSEMSWTGSIKNPSKHYELGENLEAKILDIGIENKRISLGIKQLQPNPWEKVMEKYPIGTKVTGKIRSIVEFGIFVDVGEEMDALIHISDISWMKKRINLQEEFSVEQNIEAVVLAIEPTNAKFCLGIKQLQENPWKDVETRFSIGTVVEAKVLRIADFGIFVELKEGVEGLIHISELSAERVEDPHTIAKEGDMVKAVVISLEPELQKLSLSIKTAEGMEKSQLLKEKTEEAKPVKLAEKLKGFFSGGNRNENNEEEEAPSNSDS